MEYTTLGNTGMTVSRICLGGMSFGTGSLEWTLDTDESIELIDRAVELGINFFDTANAYAGGDSERVIGQALADHDTDWTVVATKVFAPMDPDNPNSGGLSRKTIEQELRHSLDRLGMETVDLYQIHRWDEDTPIEETIRALSDAVRRGRVRYLGASSMWAHQLAEALHASDRLGVERFVSMQNHYHLAYREEEREMVPLCRKEGVGMIPWGPLARGFLARPHDELEATERGKTNDRRSPHLYAEHGAGNVEINERVAELADEKGVSMAQISLAWLLHQDGVDAPIVGVTSVDHLEEAAEAVDIDLSESDVDYLEEPYEPSPILGHE